MFLYLKNELLLLIILFVLFISKEISPDINSIVTK